MQHPVGWENLVIRSNKNGLIDFLKKTISIRNNDHQQSYQTMYKKNTHQHYSNKIKKPFKLYSQPQYARQLKFADNFNHYLSNIEEFNNLKEPAQDNGESIQNKVEKQAFNTLITIDPVATRRGKNSFRLKKQSSIRENLISKTIQPLDEKKDRGKNNFSKQMSIKTKVNEKFSIIQSDSKKTSRDQRKASFKKQDKQSSPKITLKWKINEEEFLERLNQIGGTNEKKNNFRIERTKMHKVLEQRYGNQIFTSFFQMQTKQKFDALLSMLKELLSFSTSHLQLFAFLSLDANDDGLISQDDLIFITRSIHFKSIVNDDINQIIKFVKENNIGPNPVDLSPDLLNFPTFTTLRKMRDQGTNYAPTVTNYSPFVKKFFSTGFFESNESDFGHPFPKLSKKTNNNNKNFQINFQIFQKIFDKSIPKLIIDLVYFLSKTKMMNINFIQHPTQQITNDFKKNQPIAETIEERARRQTLYATKYLQEHLSLNKTLAKFQF